LGLDKLGFSESDLVRVRGLIRQPNGIIITTGPTGSGKTTTMYSCLQEISGPHVKTITIEDPVEYALPYTTQMQVSKRTGLTLAGGLRSMLRMDPDIILAGELRDTETAIIAAEASLTGHLVFSTLRTNDAPSAIYRLASLGVEPHLIAATVTGVIAQRLARRICENCKEEMSPTSMNATTIGYILGLAAEGGYEAPKGTIFYKGKGCDQCRGKGFKGRFALAQILEMNEQLTSAILSGSTVDQFEELALQYGMRTMFADGIQKAAEGLTTIDEVMRVTFTSL
jgi:type II secretory ATPase GspE/PulE/Tfp pilus assembly ATPase PilB-like protein